MICGQPEDSMRAASCVMTRLGKVYCMDPVDEPNDGMNPVSSRAWQATATQLKGLAAQGMAPPRY